MTTTANGVDVLKACVEEPLEGVWVADVEVDAANLGDVDLTGAITLDLEGVIYQGTALPGRSEVEAGRYMLRMVGGAAGLSTAISARAYEGPNLATILEDILGAAGETLDAASVSLSGIVAPRWVRPRGAASEALDELATFAGVRWRISRGGGVLLEQGSAPFSPTEVEFDRLDLDARPRAMLIAPKGGGLVEPGQTVEGRRVMHAHTILSSKGTRQVLRFEDDRARGLWSRLIGSAVDRGLSYRALYPATVVRQRSDGTVDVLPDDEAIGARTGGLTGVTLRSGLAGWKAEVPEGTRLLVGFEAGDPTRPYAALWDRGGEVDRLTFDGGGSSVSRVGDSTLSGELYQDTSTSTLYYRPFGSPAWTPVVSDAGPPKLQTVGTPVLGQITSGNGKLRA